MPICRAPSLSWLATVVAGTGLALAGCNPAPHHSVLPYHDDALVHQSRTPYQQVSAAGTTSAATKSSSKRPASKPPTPQRRSSTSPGTQPPAVLKDGVVPTRIDDSKQRARNADGYTPRHALRYVLDTYAMNGLRFDNAEAMSIVDLYRSVQTSGTIYHSETPIVGDLVFFHNTYDANGDRRNNDWYVHVGVIESVSKSATITILSYRNGAVTRDYMNLKHAHEANVDGETANSSLRSKQKSDPAYTQYLAAELFAGFGSILGDRNQVRIMNKWKP